MSVWIFSGFVLQACAQCIGKISQRVRQVDVVFAIEGHRLNGEEEQAVEDAAGLPKFNFDQLLICFFTFLYLLSYQS